LPIACRQDFFEMRERIAAHITGTVVASDLARLFRNRRFKGPTDFGSLCEVCHVKILISIDERWELLDMADRTDQGRFLKECMKAAEERSVIKARLGKARIRTLRSNRLAWSGGPINIGYAVTQRQRLSNGTNVRRELYIDEPHAEVVHKVLRAALRLEILIWPQFRDFCWTTGIVVPPYDETLRADVGPKSVLYSKGRANMDVPHKLSVKNLQTILINPLLLGDRLYGSGKSERHTLKVVRDIQEAEGQRLDCKVQEHRKPLDAEPVPEPAILKTPEDKALFWAAAEKWLPFDLWAVRQSGYSIRANGRSTKNRAQASQVLVKRQAAYDPIHGRGTLLVGNMASAGTDGLSTLIPYSFAGAIVFATRIIARMGITNFARLGGLNRVLTHFSQNYFWPAWANGSLRTIISWATSWTSVMLLRGPNKNRTSPRLVPHRYAVMPQAYPLLNKERVVA